MISISMEIGAVVDNKGGANVHKSVSKNVKTILGVCILKSILLTIIVWNSLKDLIPSGCLTIRESILNNGNAKQMRVCNEISIASIGIWVNCAFNADPQLTTLDF